MAIKNVIVPKITKSVTRKKQIKPTRPKDKPQALQSKAPEKLERMIQLVNGLPPTLRTWEEIIEEAKGLTGKPLRDFAQQGLWIIGEPDPDRPILRLEAAMTILKGYTDDLRSSAREYVGPLHFETAMTLFFEEPYATQGFTLEETMAAALVRYDGLINARKILEEIAEHGKHVRAHRYFYEKTGRWPGTPLVSTFSGLKVTLRIGEQSRIEIKTDELLDALVGVEASRIRKCPICTSMFWAGRIDQKCCTNKCANVARVRRSRELQKENSSLYKEARIKKASKHLRATPKGISSKKRA